MSDKKIKITVKDTRHQMLTACCHNPPTACCHTPLTACCHNPPTAQSAAVVTQ